MKGWFTSAKISLSIFDRTRSRTAKKEQNSGAFSGSTVTGYGPRLGFRRSGFCFSLGCWLVACPLAHHAALPCPLLLTVLTTSLEKRRLRGDLRNDDKYLQGAGQEVGARLFPVVPSDRTRGNGHKLKQRKLQLNRRKSFFPLGVMEPWPRLPREAVESPSLEIFKTRPNVVLCSLLWVTLLRQGGWTRWPTDVPSNHNHSVILWFPCFKGRWWGEGLFYGCPCPWSSQWRMVGGTGEHSACLGVIAPELCLTWSARDAAVHRDVKLCGLAVVHLGLTKGTWKPHAALTLSLLETVPCVETAILAK